MRVLVNGQRETLEEGITVTGLLDKLGVRVEIVAVELNGEVLARSEFNSRPLSEDDRVEIVTFVGGG